MNLSKYPEINKSACVGDKVMVFGYVAKILQVSEYAHNTRKYVVKYSNNQRQSIIVTR